MKSTCILLATMLLAVIGQSQNLNYQWVKTSGGFTDDAGYAIANDANGNLFTTGFFSGTVDLDPGPGVTNLTSNGSIDIFILKLNAAGDLIWAKQIGGAGTDYGTNIVVNANGDVYVAGAYSGSNIDFNPNAGVYTLSSLGGSDIFLIKISNAGNFIWAKGLMGTETKTVKGIAVDNSDNVYTCGYFNGTMDADPGSAVANINSSSMAEDIFISKLDGAGNFVWAKAIGGGAIDQCHAISLDASSNVYVTGSFQSTVDFDPGTSIANLSSAGGADIFVLKLNQTGDYVWAKRIGSFNDESANAIVIDHAGNVILSGDYSGIVDFNPGAAVFTMTHNPNNGSINNYFALKLNNAGNFVWAKSFGGNQAFGTISSIACDNANNIYICGNFDGYDVDFDPGPAYYNMSLYGFYPEVFVLELFSTGNFVWAGQFGGSMGYYVGSSIAIDAGNNIYTTGSFNDECDFDPGPAYLPVYPNGGFDMFIHKLSSNICTQPTLPTISASSTVLCQGQSATLSIASGNLNSATSWNWYQDFCGGTPVGSGSSITVSPLNSTGYFVRGEGGCVTPGNCALQNIIVGTCVYPITLRLFIQGYYSGNSMMQPVLMNQGLISDSTITDSVDILFYNASTLQQEEVIQTVLYTNGYINFNLPFSIVGSYYIAIRHRNSLLTWSSVPLAFPLTSSYDFTTAANKAYGDNQVNVGSGVFAIYSADVNQDDNVDLLDASQVEIDISNFEYGYFNTDINGDGNVDLLDYPLLETNISSFVFAQHP